MARTINEGFQQLRRNLEITGLQEQTVSTRQTNIRQVLEADLAVLDTFLTGSYRRSTMIAPLKDADIDVFVVLDPKYYSAGGQHSLLEKVKTSLRKTYTRTPNIRPDGQAVTVVFDDFKVDVVPGFYRQGGGYLIPDSGLGRWIETDPKRHVELWSASNKAHNGDLVPLLKMVKGWNKSRNLLQSFHLEVLARSVLEGVTISDFPSGLRFVFDKAQAKIGVNLPDPAGYGDDVGAHVNTAAAVDNIVNRLEWARARASEAEAAAGSGRVAAAFEKWRLLLPDHFPAYG
jgi:hypothetical protein